MRHLFLLTLASLSAGCVTRSVEPSTHRARATECARQRGPGRPQPGPPGGSGPGTCTSDADCTTGDGKNGRCAPQGNGRMAPTNRCSYDGCFSDGDCGQGVCECTHDATTPADWSGGHYCSAPGNCKVDADCGAGGFCSPSSALCSHGGGNQGYFCHTWKDECRRNEDCKQKEIKNWSHVQTACIYSAPTGRWVCASEGCPVG